MKSKTVPMRDADGYESLEPVAGKPLPAEIVLPKIVIEGFKYPESEWFERAFHIREQHLLESMECERELRSELDAANIAEKNAYMEVKAVADIVLAPGDDNDVKGACQRLKSRIVELEQAVRELAKALNLASDESVSSSVFESWHNAALASPIVKEILERKP